MLDENTCAVQLCLSAPRVVHGAEGLCQRVALFETVLEKAMERGMGEGGGRGQDEVRVRSGLGRTIIY